MRTIIFTAMMLLSVPCLYAQEIRLFDPGVLGQPVDHAVKILLPADAKAIEPKAIQLDVQSGKYSGAIARYGRSISLEEARESLNRKYKKFEQPSFSDNKQMGLWRVTDAKFAIQLNQDEEGTSVLYLPFKNAKTDEE